MFPSAIFVFSEIKSILYAWNLDYLLRVADAISNKSKSTWSFILRQLSDKYRMSNKKDGQNAYDLQTDYTEKTEVEVQRNLTRKW